MVRIGLKSNCSFATAVEEGMETCSRKLDKIKLVSAFVMVYRMIYGQKMVAWPMTVL